MNNFENIVCLCIACPFISLYIMGAFLTAVVFAISAYKADDLFKVDSMVLILFAGVSFFITLPLFYYDTHIKK